MSHIDPTTARVTAASIRTETADPWIGRVIAGEFELVERLGAGVQGTVYRALQRPFDRPVALKLLTGPNAENAQYRLRFLREARALELLHHPSIVRLLRYGTIREDGVQPGGLYIAEALVEGTSLEAVIDADGALAPSRALRIAARVLDALTVAHRHGVAHRDIKPAHIMLHRDGHGEEQVTLIDFGLTRRENGFDDDDEDLTQAGWLLGSPLYMAPEPLAELRMGPAADQYSLGVVLYEMLTGRPPFSGTLESVLLGHAIEPVPALPGELDPAGALGEIIHRALAKEPASRYPTPGAMQAAIERAGVMLDDDGDTRVEPPCPSLMALIAERRAEQAAERIARRRSSLPQPRQRTRWLLTTSAVAASLVVASAAAAASLLF